MTDEEWKKAKATMPWRQESGVVHGLGGVYRLLDNKGKEVSIPLFLAVLERLTAHIAKS